VQQGIVIVTNPTETVGEVYRAGAVYMLDTRLTSLTVKKESDRAKMDQGIKSISVGGDVMGLVKRFHAEIPTENALFGHKLQLNSGLVVIPNPKESVHGLKDAGAVYILGTDTLDSIETAEFRRLSSLVPEQKAMFGTSVLIQDGLGVIGAPGETVTISAELADLNRGKEAHNFTFTKGVEHFRRAGAAYLFPADEPRTAPLTRVMSPIPEQGAAFGGGQLAYEPRVLGGGSNVIITAPFESFTIRTHDIHDKYAGAVYTINIQKLNISPVRVVSLFAKENGLFGTSVAVKNDMLLIGSAKGNAQLITRNMIDERFILAPKTSRMRRKSREVWIGNSMNMIISSGKDVSIFKPIF